MAPWERAEGRQAQKGGWKKGDGSFLLKLKSETFRAIPLFALAESGGRGHRARGPGGRCYGHLLNGYLA